MTSNMSVYVAITGANRGLGLEFAKQVGIVLTVFCTPGSAPLQSTKCSAAWLSLPVQLLEKGNIVIATCRNPQKADTLNELANTHKDKLIILPLDVMDEASVKVLSVDMLAI